MERLTAEYKLEKIRQDLECQREQMQKQKEQDEWLAEQKKELLQHRIKRLKAREVGSLPHSNELQETIYDPSSGFVLYWDFLLDIPPRYREIQLAYGFYDDAIAKTPVKLCFSFSPFQAFSKLFQALPPFFSFFFFFICNSVGFFVMDSLFVFFCFVLDF